MFQNITTQVSLYRKPIYDNDIYIQVLSVFNDCSLLFRGYLKRIISCPNNKSDINHLSNDLA